MKNAIFLFTLSLISLFGFSQFPDLIVLSGQIKQLPARTYQYNNIDIQNGGLLIIDDNSQQWCIFHCLGNIKIQGKISFRKFTSLISVFNATAPDGTSLTYSFSMQNRGGKGGVGGEGAGRAAPFRIMGADGALPTNLYGGGGGSGPNVLPVPPNTLSPGLPGNGSRGGLRQGVYDGQGGDGGIRPPFSNGGILYLFSMGDFDGTGGEIDLRGENGENGKPGANGLSPGHLHGGAGGGGGGGPAGEGGKLIVKIRGNYINYPSVLLQGGIGGNPGQGGIATNGGVYVPPLRNGSVGEKGEDGATGSVDFTR